MSFIETFDPANHTLLGEGVWGRVYDLKDGTVLKIAKEVGGIGSGREKVLHELAILKELEEIDCAADFSWPKVIDHGDIPAGWDRSGAGYSIWMRSTKLPGSALQLDQIKGFSGRDQESIAVSLGKTLAQFHKALRTTDLAGSLKPDQILHEERLLSVEDVERLKAVRSINANMQRNLKPIHGDFNISNIQFGSDLMVCGVLDFAETCLGYDEDDISSLTSELPFLKEKIIKEYEQCSGRSIDPENMIMADMKRDLISMIICRYKINQPQDAQKAQSRLDHSLRQLMGLSI